MRRLFESGAAKNMSFQIFVVVIQKEGLVGRACIFAAHASFIISETIKEQLTNALGTVMQMIHEYKQ